MNRAYAALSDDRRNRAAGRLPRLSPDKKLERLKHLRIPPGFSFVLGVIAAAIFVGASPEPTQALAQEVYGNEVIDANTAAAEARTVLGDVAVNGTVENGVGSVFGNIRVNGPVGGDVRAGFGDVSIREPVVGTSRSLSETSTSTRASRETWTWGAATSV